MNRRTLLSGAAAVSLSRPVFSSTAGENPFRVGVIGHTGRGNYGHGLDKVWLRLPETRIVAVADADTGGLEKARQRLKVEKGFSDYREMLDKERPEIVAVCPRHPDQHAAMILEAIAAGAAGIYVEKPFVRTLVEVDQIREAAAKTGVKIAVAHRNRYHPTLGTIDRILQNDGDRKIGKLLEIRGRGKGDQRGGDEDLWVLGTHVLNLFSYFGGKPLEGSASLYHRGEKVAKHHIHEGKEALGPLAADEIHARFRMERGFTAFWDSVANDGTKNHGFGLHLVGSEGAVAIKCDGKPLAHFRNGNPFDPANRSTWEPIGPEDPGQVADVHNHVTACRDLIEAIRQDRQPLCDLEEGALTVEMVMAVFASHFQGGGGVAIPLGERNHPLDLG